MNDHAHYKVGSEWRTITRQDYEAGSGVEPVSDPTMVSDMQKLGRAQFLMGFAMDPYCDGMEISTQPEDFRHRGLGGLQGEQRRHHIAHVRADLRGRQAPP